MSVAADPLHFRERDDELEEGTEAVVVVGVCQRRGAAARKLVEHLAAERFDVADDLTFEGRVLVVPDDGEHPVRVRVHDRGHAARRWSVIGFPQ